MNRFQKVLSWLKGIRKVTEYHNITALQASKLDPALERARGYAEGQVLAEKKKRKYAEEKLTEKKSFSLNKRLQKQSDDLKYGHLEGSFSMKRFFEYQKKAFKSDPRKLKGGMSQTVGLLLDPILMLQLLLGKRRRPISAISEDHSTTFGPIWDIIATRNGGLVVIILDENGKKVPIVSGNSPKDLFRNYTNLNEGVSHGQMMINAYGNGAYAPHIMAEEVDELIQGPDGDVYYNQMDKKPFRDLLREKDSVIQRLSTQSVAAKKELERTRLKASVLDQEKEILMERAESNAAVSQAAIDSTSSLKSTLMSMKQDLASLAFSKDIAESRLRHVLEKLDDFSKLDAKRRSESAFQRHLEEFREVMDTLANSADKVVVQPAKSKGKSTKTESVPLGEPDTERLANIEAAAGAQ